MKKIFLAVLALMMCVSMCSCCCTSIFTAKEKPSEIQNNEEENETSKHSGIIGIVPDTSKEEDGSQVKEEDVSQVPEPVDPYADATALIKEGKYAEAYAILFAAKEDEEAAKRLENFVWRCTEAKTYYMETMSVGQYTYTYDEKGNLVKEEYNEGDYTEVIYYTYDEEGRLEEERVSRPSESYRIEYDYNENGDLSIETRYEDGENVTDNTKTLYSYDDQNRLIRVGKLWKAIYTELYSLSYDSQGNLIEELYPDGDSIKYYYDENGVLIKEQSTFSGKTKCPFVYTYDENGNLLSYLHEEEPGCNCIYYYSEARYTYDVYGNMLTEDHIEGHTNYITYVCFYIGEDIQ